MREESSFGGDFMQLTALCLKRDKTSLISSESVLSQRHRTSRNVIHFLVRITVNDTRHIQIRSHKEPLVSSQSAEAAGCIAHYRSSV